MDYCWKCQYPNVTRDWRSGDPIPPMVQVSEDGVPLDKVKVCDNCGGCMVESVRQIEVQDTITQHEWICRCATCGLVYDYWTVKADPEKTPPIIEQSGTGFTGKRTCVSCAGTRYFIMGIVERVENVTARYLNKPIPVPKPGNPQ